MLSEWRANPIYFSDQIAELAYIDRKGVVGHIIGELWDEVETCKPQDAFLRRKTLEAYGEPKVDEVKVDLRFGPRHLARQKLD